MAVLLDASLVLAAADVADLNHARARAWLERVDEPLLLCALSLGDVDLVLRREIGPRAATAVLEAIEAGSVRLVAPTDVDLARAIVLLEQAAEHRPRLADALIVAAAERLGITRLATFERRPFAVLRPAHVRAFALEP